MVAQNSSAQSNLVKLGGGKACGLRAVDVAGGRRGGGGFIGLGHNASQFGRRMIGGAARKQNSALGKTPYSHTIGRPGLQGPNLENGTVQAVAASCSWRLPRAFEFY
ncbi:MAG: hypothetical protein RIA64_03865 [Rhodospirillales bacterium]